MSHASHLLLYFVFSLLFVNIFAQLPQKKVCFLYNRAPDDLGWNYNHDRARLAVSSEFRGIAELTTTYQVVSSTEVASAVGAGTTFVQSGCHLIIGTSSNFQAAMTNLANLYPNVSFAVVAPTSGPLRNLAAVVHNGHEAFYLGGIAAGFLASHARAGAVVGNLISSTYRMLNAFLIGARSVNPNFNLSVLSSSGYNQQTKVKKSVLKLHNEQNVDIMIGIVTTTDVTAFSTSQGIPNFGYPSELLQVNFGPLVYSGCELDWRPAYRQLIGDIVSGTWKENLTLSYAMAEGAVKLTPISEFVNYEAWNVVNDRMNSLLQKKICIFSNQSKEVAESFNATSFDSQGCLLASLVQKMSQFVPGVTSLGTISDSEVYRYKYVELGSGSAIALSVVVCCFLVVIFISIILVAHFRKTVLIISTNEIFCYCLLLGAGLGYADIFFWIGKPSDRICDARIWFLAVSFGLIFGSISAKAYRMWRIWRNPQLMEHKKSKYFLFGFIFSICVVHLGFLVALSTLNGYVAGDVFDEQLEFDELYSTCKLNEDGIIILSLILAFDGLLIIITAVLGYLSRSVSKKFNDTSSIILSVYSILISLIVVIILFISTNTRNPNTQMIFIACGVFIAITFPIVSLFAPKFLILMREGISVSSNSSNMKIDNSTVDK